MLELQEINGGFELYWRGRLIISHTENNPFIKLGCGEGSYRMRRGSFKMREQVKAVHSQDHVIFEKAGPELVTLLFPLLEVSFQSVENRLLATFRLTDENMLDEINRCRLRLTALPGEHIYGGGEQFSHLNLKGRKLPVWCQEQGIGRGRDLVTFIAELTHGAGGSWHTTYFPQPTFISSSGWYCHVDTSCYLEADFTQTDFHEFYIWGIPRQLIFGQEQDMAGAVTSLSHLIGRQPPLPDWALDGVWLGIQGGRKAVEDKLDKALQAGIKVTAVWCQDWQGIRMTPFGKQLMWDWRWDDELYPDLPGMIKSLNSRGIRFLGYINPFLALDGELYQVARDKGYLVRKPGGSEYHVYVTSFPVAMIDLSNPEAVGWVKQIIKDNMLGIGLSGWMADFGEFLPVDSLLASGEDGATFHNRYPVLWAQANREAVEEAGLGCDATFFSRSGYSGSSSQAPLIWAGDQLVNWSRHDGLPSVIPAGISLGLCGIGHYHSDIGGYTTISRIVRRSRELFMRWAEHAAFTAVMRSHEGNMPWVNHHFDSDLDTLAHLARMSQVYCHLKPYLQASLLEYQQMGLPLMRHLALHYGSDSKVHRLQCQYLLGRDLLVAPVIKRWRRKWTVYIPQSPDRWIHLFSGKEYGPGRHRVAAPLGCPPVFYRVNSPWAGLFSGLQET